MFEIVQRGDKIVGKTSESEYELDALSGTTLQYSGNNAYAGSGTVSLRTDDRGRVTGLKFQNGAELAKLK